MANIVITGLINSLRAQAPPLTSYISRAIVFIKEVINKEAKNVDTKGEPEVQKGNEKLGKSIYYRSLEREENESPENPGDRSRAGKLPGEVNPKVASNGIFLKINSSFWLSVIQPIIDLLRNSLNDIRKQLEARGIILVRAPPARDANRLLTHPTLRSFLKTVKLFYYYANKVAGGFLASLPNLMGASPATFFNKYSRHIGYLILKVLKTGGLLWKNRKQISNSSISSSSLKRISFLHRPAATAGLKISSLIWMENGLKNRLIIILNTYPASSPIVLEIRLTSPTAEPQSTTSTPLTSANTQYARRNTQYEIGGSAAGASSSINKPELPRRDFMKAAGIAIAALFGGTVVWKWFKYVSKTDEAGRAGVDTSIGWGQVKPSTVKKLAESGYIDRKFTGISNREIARLLDNDKFNVDTAAAYIRYLADLGARVQKNGKNKALPDLSILAKDAGEWEKSKDFGGLIVALAASYTAKLFKETALRRGYWKPSFDYNVYKNPVNKKRDAYQQASVYGYAVKEAYWMFKEMGIFSGISTAASPIKNTPKRASSAVGEKSTADSSMFSSYLPDRRDSTFFSRENTRPSRDLDCAGSSLSFISLSSLFIPTISSSTPVSRSSTPVSRSSTPVSRSSTPVSRISMAVILSRVLAWLAAIPSIRAVKFSSRLSNFSPNNLKLPSSRSISVPTSVGVNDGSLTFFRFFFITGLILKQALKFVKRNLKTIKLFYYAVGEKSTADSSMLIGAISSSSAAAGVNRRGFEQWGKEVSAMLMLFYLTMSAVTAGIKSGNIKRGDGLIELSRKQLEQLEGVIRILTKQGPGALVKILTYGGRYKQSDVNHTILFIAACLERLKQGKSLSPAFLGELSRELARIKWIIENLPYLLTLASEETAALQESSAPAIKEDLSKVKESSSSIETKLLPREPGIFQVKEIIAGVEAIVLLSDLDKIGLLNSMLGKTEVNKRLSKGFDLVSDIYQKYGGIGHRLYAGDEISGILPLSCEGNLENIINEMRRALAEVGLLISTAAIRTDEIERTEDVSKDYGVMLQKLNEALNMVKESSDKPYKIGLAGVAAHDHNKGVSVLKEDNYMPKLLNIAQRQRRVIAESGLFYPDEINTFGAVKPEALRKRMGNLTGNPDYMFITITSHFQINKAIQDYLETKTESERKDLMTHLKGHVRFKAINSVYGYLGGDEYIALLFAAVSAKLLYSSKSFFGKEFRRKIAQDIDSLSFVMRTPRGGEALETSIERAGLGGIAGFINARSTVKAALEVNAIPLAYVNGTNRLYELAELLKIVEKSADTVITSDNNVVKVYDPADEPAMIKEARAINKVRGEIAYELLKAHLTLFKYKDVADAFWKASSSIELTKLAFRNKNFLMDIDDIATLDNAAKELLAFLLMLNKYLQDSLQYKKIDSYPHVCKIASYALRDILTAQFGNRISKIGRAHV